MIKIVFSLIAVFAFLLLSLFTGFLILVAYWAGSPPEELFS